MHKEHKLHRGADFLWRTPGLFFSCVQGQQTQGQFQRQLLYLDLSVLLETPLISDCE